MSTYDLTTYDGNRERASDQLVRGILTMDEYRGRLHTLRVEFEHPECPECGTLTMSILEYALTGIAYEARCPVEGCTLRAQYACPECRIVGHPGTACYVSRGVRPMAGEAGVDQSRRLVTGLPPLDGDGHPECPHYKATAGVGCTLHDPTGEHAYYGRNLACDRAMVELVEAWHDAPTAKRELDSPAKRYAARQGTR